MERYRFPILTASEIYIQLKNSLSIPVTSEEEITKPKYESIKEIYLGLLSISFHKTREQIINFSPQELAMLKYPDTGEIIQSNIKIFKYLKYALSRIGCQDDEFKATDILNPDFKRTRKFLSAFINYLRFMTEEQEMLTDTYTGYVKGRASTEELDRLKEEKNALTLEVQNLQRSQVEVKPIIDQKMAQLAEVEAEKKKISEERLKFEEELEMLKIEIEKCEKAISELDRFISDLETDKARFEQEIVENPEQYISIIEQKQKINEEHTQNLLTEQIKNSEVTTKAEKMKNSLDCLREVSILLQTTELSKAKHKELLKTLEEHKHELLMLEKDFHNNKLNESTLDSNIKSNSNLLGATQKKSEVKIYTTESSLTAKKNEKEYEEKNNKDLTQELNIKQKELEQLQEQFKALEDKHIKTMRELKEEHDKTVEKAQIYVKKVLQTIENHDFTKVVRDVSHFKNES